MGLLFHHHPFPGKYLSNLRDVIRIPEMPHDSEYVRYRFANRVSSEWVPMVYRFFAFAFVLTIYILGLLNYEPGQMVRDFSYLTKWGVILDWFIFLMLILAHWNYPVSAWFCGKDTNGHKKMVKYYHLSVEVMQFIIVSTDVCIMIMYWSFLFKPNGDTSKEYGVYDRITDKLIERLPSNSDDCIDSSTQSCNLKMTNYAIFLTFMFHLVCPMLVIIEFLFNRVPVRKRHLFYLLAFGIIYIFGVNMPVSLASYPVYSIMTWRSGWTAIYCTGAVALAFIGGGLQFLFRWHKIQLKAADSLSSQDFEGSCFQGAAVTEYAENAENIEGGNSFAQEEGIEMHETTAEREEPARRQSGYPQV